MLTIYLAQTSLVVTEPIRDDQTYLRNPKCSEKNSSLVGQLSKWQKHSADLCCFD